MSTLNLKKVLALSLFLALAPYLVNAQVEWLDPSFNPVNDLSIPIWRKGRVGIGIDNPSRPLHLRGSNTVLQIDRDTKDPGFGVTRWSPGFGEVWKSFFFYTEGNGPNDGRFIIADWGQNVRGPSTPRFVIDNVGNIGVGTVNPDAKLHVVTTSNNNRDNTALFRAPNIGPNSSHIHWGPQGDWYIRSANVKGRVILQDVGGYVGVGTATPNRTLHLVGGTETSIITRIESQNVNGSTIDFKDPNTTGDWLARIGGKGDGLTFIAGGVERMNINPNGYVGIGTATPNRTLHLVGGIETSIITRIESQNVNGSTIDFKDPNTTGDWLARIGGKGDGLTFIAGGVERMNINPNGFVGIGTTSPQSALDVNGTTTTEILTITGGADIAEPFEITSSDETIIEAGSVVIIDENNPGKLELSNGAYDQKVIGVISGANGVSPGMVLSQKEVLGGGENIAISGRVYVKANISNGLIKPGDFLSTSNVAGEAMKVTDYEKARGAIIGKAMSAINEEGYVLVFITLQ